VIPPHGAKANALYFNKGFAFPINQFSIRVTEYAKPIVTYRYLAIKDITRIALVARARRNPVPYFRARRTFPFATKDASLVHPLLPLCMNRMALLKHI
jgi:hypothetical protein